MSSVMTLLLLLNGFFAMTFLTYFSGLFLECVPCQAQEDLSKLQNLKSLPCNLSRLMLLPNFKNQDPNFEMIPIRKKILFDTFKDLQLLN